MIKRTKGRNLVAISPKRLPAREARPWRTCVLHLTSGGRTREGGCRAGHRSVRKEPNKGRKVGLIGCRRRNLAVSICHSGRYVSLARPATDLGRARFLYLPALSASPRGVSARAPVYTHVESAFGFGAVAPVRTNAGRILREFWRVSRNLRGIRSTYPRGSRQKSHDCRARPRPRSSGARPACQSGRLGFERSR